MPVDPVKIVDLAAQLGLDKSTVSRALNNRPGVAPETRERIMRMARELGYSPNVHGQQLRGWKSTTLALVLGGNVDRLSPHFFGPFTLQLYRAASERGHDLMILSYHHHKSDSIADVLVRRGGVGGVLLGWQPDAVLEAMSNSVMPCVQLDNYAEHFPTVDYVTSENRPGSLEVTRHLMSLGHRRIAFVADWGPVLEGADVTLIEGLSPFSERYDGFLEALGEAGQAEVLVGPKEGDLPSYVARLLNSPQAPTAIVAASDLVAAEVAEVARAMGRQIPGDISLTGFDDVDQHLVHNLDLTTVRVDQAAQADAAVDLLLNPDRARPERIENRIPTKLVVRGSTAPPRTIPDSRRSQS